MDFNFKILLLIGIISCTGLVSGDIVCPENGKFVVCYYASWAHYRPGNGQFTLNHIDPGQCTHLVYTFAGIDIDGLMESLDYENDITNGAYLQFNELKARNPCLKTLLAIGGWNEGSEKYSLMAETERSRDRFTDGILRFLVHFAFDGLDFDWEYPTQRGGIPEDRENFIEILKILYQKLSARNRLLTVAVAAPIGIIQEAYNIAEMCNNVDYVFVMGYDLQETNYTSTHAPLRRELSELVERPTVDDAIQYYISNGCPANKLVLGIPAFGRSFTLDDPTETGIGAPANVRGTPGTFTQEEGFLGFNEICFGITAGGWTTEYLVENAVKIAWNGNQWVSYDDVESVEAKAKYSEEYGLAGVMFWSIDTDDFLSICYGKFYPLLSAANEFFGNFMYEISTHVEL